MFIVLSVFQLSVPFPFPLAQTIVFLLYLFPWKLFYSGFILYQGKLSGELEHRGEDIGEDDKEHITTPHDPNNPELPSPRIREATTEPDGSYYSYEATKAGKHFLKKIIDI